MKSLYFRTDYIEVYNYPFTLFLSFNLLPNRYIKYNFFFNNLSLIYNSKLFLKYLFPFPNYFAITSVLSSYSLTITITQTYPKVFPLFIRQPHQRLAFYDSYSSPNFCILQVKKNYYFFTIDHAL